MTRIDALLGLMVLVWGANFSVIKRAFEEVPPQPFNAVRLVIASAVFLAAIEYAKRRARRAYPNGSRPHREIKERRTDRGHHEDQHRKRHPRKGPECPREA